MLVGKWMTPDPLTIQVSEPVTEAVLLMKDRGIRHLPVLDGDRLAGIVSDRDLKEFTPSRATSLDVYELHYLLAKTRIGEVMRKDPIRVTPEDTIEKAALLMHDKKIGSLPVVDGKGKLVGVLTEVDVFEALVTVTGCRSGTVRLQMTIPDEPGSLKEVADRVRAHGLNLRSILTTYVQVPAQRRELVLRVEGESGALEAELRREYPDLTVHKGC